MLDREEAGILAASLSNIEGQSNDPGLSSLQVSYLNSNQNIQAQHNPRRSHETKSLLAGMKNVLERIQNQEIREDKSYSGEEQTRKP